MVWPGPARNLCGSQDRRADRDTAVREYASKLLEDSLAKPDNFVQVGTPGYPTLMQGKEFVSYLGRGGAFDPMSTVVTDLKLGGGA